MLDARGVFAVGVAIGVAIGAAVGVVVAVVGLTGTMATGLRLTLPDLGVFDIGVVGVPVPAVTGVPAPMFLNG